MTGSSCQRKNAMTRKRQRLNCSEQQHAGRGFRLEPLIKHATGRLFHVARLLAQARGY